MHLTTLTISLVFAIAATVKAANVPTEPLPAGLIYARKALQRRTDIPPETACGEGFDDCGGGWCCSSGTSCAGTMNDVPICKNPTATTGLLGPGTDVATPYENLEAILTSLQDAYSDLTALQIPTELPDVIPDDDEPKTTANGGPENTGRPQGAEETGAAVRYSSSDMTPGFLTLEVLAACGFGLMAGAGVLLR